MIGHLRSCCLFCNVLLLSGLLLVAIAPNPAMAGWVEHKVEPTSCGGAETTFDYSFEYQLNSAQSECLAGQFEVIGEVFLYDKDGFLNPNDPFCTFEIDLCEKGTGCKWLSKDNPVVEESGSVTCFGTPQEYPDGDGSETTLEVFFTVELEIPTWALGCGNPEFTNESSPVDLEQCEDCDSHDHKGCVGNDQHWFDSCDKEEDWLQTCDCGCDSGECMPDNCGPCKYCENGFCAHSSNGIECNKGTNSKCFGGVCEKCICWEPADCCTDGCHMDEAGTKCLKGVCNWCTAGGLCVPVPDNTDKNNDCYGDDATCLNGNCAYGKCPNGVHATCCPDGWQEAAVGKDCSSTWENGGCMACNADGSCEPANEGDECKPEHKCIEGICTHCD